MTGAREILKGLIIENAEQVERTTNEAVDVGFFGIRLHKGSKVTATELVSAMRDAFDDGEGMNLSTQEFRGRAVGYPDLGSWLGDQGMGLALVGLGALLGLWKVVLPRDTGVTSAAVEAQMLNMGFVMVEAGPSSPLLA